MASTEGTFTLSSSWNIHVFDYKQAEIIANRLFDWKFWVRKASDRAKIELDYYQHLQQWFHKHHNTNETEYDLESFLLGQEEHSQQQLELSQQTSKLYSDLADTFKKMSNFQESSSVEYSALLRKYKMAIRTHQRKSKDTLSAKKKYESKLKQLISCERDLRSNQKKVHKLKDQADLAQKILEYHQLIETDACKHLLQISDELRATWQENLKEKLEFVLNKWKKCVSDIQKIMRNFQLFDTYHIADSLPTDNDELLSAVNSLADKLYTSIQLSQQTAEDSRPPSRAPSEISIAGSEYSYSFTFGSDIESIEDISQFDDIRYHGNHYRLYAPPQGLGLRTPAGTGWLKDFDSVDETSESIKNGDVDTKSGRVGLKSYGIKMKAVKDYKKNNHREISLKDGQLLRQMLPANETGYAFGYKRNRFNKRCFGYFPASHVLPL